MNYIGSKLTLLPFVYNNIIKVAGETDTFADLFAGTGVVSGKFKREGYRVFANDIQYFSYALLKNKIGNHKYLTFNSLVIDIPELVETSIELRANVVCNYLMNILDMPGFVYDNYCFGGTRRSENPRQYFSDYNGIRIDTMRIHIQKWWDLGKLESAEYFFLLASLLESVDRCANTASVYGSFLKTMKTSAREPIILSPSGFTTSPKPHVVGNYNANNLARVIKADVVYLDPPYGKQQYGVNYHLLETIARYDNPDISGKCGVRTDAFRSKYSNITTALSAFKDLIKSISAKYIFLSYSNEGLMSVDDIARVLGSVGKYDYTTIRNGRYKSDSDKNREYTSKKTTEYLHWVKVRK